MHRIRRIALADQPAAAIMRGMELLIQPLRKVIQVTPGANLLEALRAAQIPVSYSCMAGRCGTCRCRVLQGEVLDTGRPEQNPLNARDSHVLACQTFVTGPCTIEIEEPDEIVVHPARILKTTVQSVEAVTHDIRRVVLRSPKPLEFSPGQYAQLQFTPEHMRPYSMAGLAGDGTLEFHVRVVPQGRVSGYIDQQLNPASIDDSAGEARFFDVPDPLIDDYGYSWSARWLTRMTYSRRQLLEKMTLVWHEHFPTSIGKIGSDAWAKG
jgi:ferredoxin